MLILSFLSYLIDRSHDPMVVKIPIKYFVDVSAMYLGEQNQSDLIQHEPMDVDSHITPNPSQTAPSLGSAQAIDCQREVNRPETGGINSTIPAIPQKQKNEYDRSYIQDNEQLCKPFKEVLNYLIRQTKIEDQLEIDPESQDSILKSLILGNISSLDTLQKDDYQIVPPGVLFHTWMPLYGTAIFDGSNNVKGIDYTQRLLDEADQFDEWGIPIIIVYSKEGMEPDEVIKMEKWINIHRNILLMNVEEDLLTWNSFD